MPVPDSDTLSGVLVALVAMESLADLIAALSGVNVTLIVHEPPAARFAGQSLVCANHEAPVPVTLIPVTENGTAPLFATVAFSGPPVVPTATLPNLKLVGLTAAATFTVSFLTLAMLFAEPEIVA